MKPETPLPSGTVTFLFTDIQGSVPLWERSPEQMAAALQIHNINLRQAITANGGAVFKTVGDAFQAAFPTAPQALKAAIQGQRALQAAGWNELGPLNVRMGLHTGEAELDPGGDEYTVSHTKNRIGRIHAVAHGGQILLSQETADLVQRSLPEGVSLKDLGEHRLKGMQWREHLYQICAPDLPQEFPALETALTRPNNLPVQLTSFIGRETEITAVLRLLAEHRLITLTGSGGTGKSRLSLRVAAEVLEQYPHGAWLVELAPLADPALVLKTVASALGLQESPGRDLQESLVSFLQQRHLLLILDNCEHLLEACASLAGLLLRACPNLTIMASSREILGVTGETPFRVPSMALPDIHHLPPLEALAQCDAVRLFIARGQVALPGFTLTPANALTVAQVVTRLDGIPLAIELAAARLRLLSLEQISRRLNDAFRLLTGGSRTVLPRHQTLRALIDWSYHLLTEAERALLRRLSVFAGGWSLEAAEQVCFDESKAQGAIPPEAILDLLGGLVDKSMIQSTHAVDGSHRFAMLETVRQYAHEKLADAQEAETARARHMQYFCRLAETLGPKIRSREQVETLDCLEAELGNLRLALEWALQTDIETELKMATALRWLWHIRNYWTEGIAWLERGLEAEQASRALPAASRAVIRAEALSVLGFHLLIKGASKSDQVMGEKSRLCLEESKELFQAYGQENSAGYAWAVLLSGGLFVPPERCQKQAREALRIFRQIGDAHGTAESLQNAALADTDMARKRELHQEQLAVDQANGDIEGIATALYHMGIIDWKEAEWEHARQVYEASLAYYQQVRNRDLSATVLIFLGYISIFLGDFSRAEAYIQEALAACADFGNDYMAPICWMLQGLAGIAAGRLPQAAEALEPAGELNDRVNNPLVAAWLLAVRARLARLRNDASQAQQLACEGLKIKEQLPQSSPDVWLELGHQALERGDLPMAESSWREGIQCLVRFNIDSSWDGYLDGLALLAARQGQAELAARLAGTRWCRSYSHWLSPSERESRAATRAELERRLGETRFARLSQAGQALTFTQMLVMVREFMGLD